MAAAQLSPCQLIFPAGVTKSFATSFMITNPGHVPIAYDIEASDPSTCLLRPQRGLLQPHASKRILVVLQETLGAANQPSIESSHTSTIHAVQDTQDRNIPVHTMAIEDGQTLEDSGLCSAERTTCTCLPIINLKSFDRGMENQTSPALEAAVAEPGSAHDARAWLLQHNPQQDCSYKDHALEQMKKPASYLSSSTGSYRLQTELDAMRLELRRAQARLDAAVAWLLQLRQDESLLDVEMQQYVQEDLRALNAA